MCIAVIDDLSSDRAVLRRHLEAELAARKLEVQIEEYDSGEAFLDAFRTGAFTAVFLDIYMGAVSGLEVARLLYRQDPSCKIVFLTTSQEFMLESYEVRATYYLVKPFAPDKLSQALDFCFPAPMPDDTLVVRTKSGSSVLQRRDILYIESVTRHGCVRLADRLVESADSFADVVAPLESDGRFLVCARGVMIHMAHVSEQSGGDFIMEDGRRLPISRRIRVEVLRAFQNFALKAMQGVG